MDAPAAAVSSAAAAHPPPLTPSAAAPQATTRRHQRARGPTPMLSGTPPHSAVGPNKSVGLSTAELCSFLYQRLTPSQPEEVVPPAGASKEGRLLGPQTLSPGSPDSSADPIKVKPLSPLTALSPIPISRGGGLLLIFYFNPLKLSMVKSDRKIKQGKES